MLVSSARPGFSRLKLVRAYLFCAASLAAAMVSGDFVLAQAPADDHGVPRGPARPPGLPAQAPAAPKNGVALAPKPAPEAIRKQMLDRLFDRLRNAGDPGDAQRIAASIERVWLQSDSDTANLLMQRAMVSMQARQYPLALSLFDKLVALEPDWAEAWNQRATTRFLTGDTDGAMADIDRVIKLEPRHFGALAGMGMILQGAGLEKSALEIFKKALGIYPLEPDIRKLVEKLTLEIEGQDI
jgi:tetratricopeptide (TPR) repeat protein